MRTQTQAEKRNRLVVVPMNQGFYKIIDSATRSVVTYRGLRQDSFGSRQSAELALEALRLRLLAK